MFAVAPLQLSWFAAVFTSWIVSPVQAPTPVPDGTVVVPTAPPIEKSAGVHAGFVESVPPPEIELTTAVIDEICTEPAFGLSKFPLSVTAGPPGYRPETLLVWFTVMFTVFPAVAVPVPEPLLVQYAYAATAAPASTTTMPASRKIRFLVMGCP